MENARDFRQPAGVAGLFTLPVGPGAGAPAGSSKQQRPPFVSTPPETEAGGTPKRGRVAANPFDAALPRLFDHGAV